MRRTAAAVRPEPRRARYPDRVGYVERDGVRVFYEVFGVGQPEILFLPTWSIVHSRCWKMQIPYLSRHGRVITFDPRGNGRSDRPTEPEAYDQAEFAGDALAVLDATGTQRAFLVGWSAGAQRALLLAAEQPERVRGLIFIGPSLPLAARPPWREVDRWDEKLETDEGWAKSNRYYWLRDYPGFLEFFFTQVFPEPHSTKAIEDCVGWGRQTTPELMIATRLAADLDDADARRLCARVKCPVLVINGTADAITGQDAATALAELTGGELVLLEGAGHAPHVRHPVKVNRLLRQFTASHDERRREA